MSLRSPVERSEIDSFLMQLGAKYRGTGRIYLVGGTTLVFEGFREQTLDIDVVIEAKPEDYDFLITLIRELKDRLDINVEEASPGDFIPLPAGYADRHRFIGRFGQLDVFHFDLYSVALSKIERGRQQDFQDVILLLRNKRIEWIKLEQFFQEILPEMGRKSLRQDPIEFQLNFDALEKMWRETGG